MKRLSFIWFAGLLCLCTTMVSCVGTAPMKEVRLIDSLNQVAYAFRYKNLDSSCHAASRAYREVSLYKQGKAEASNNLGFCAFMRMDFEQAEKFHMEFYDYRNSALHRMKRIAEDDNLFVDQHEQMRLNYARSEFYIVSAVYYYYLQQRPEAVASINEVTKKQELLELLK